MITWLLQVPQIVLVESLTNSPLDSTIEVLSGYTGGLEDGDWLYPGYAGGSEYDDSIFPEYAEVLEDGDWLWPGYADGLEDVDWI